MSHHSPGTPLLPGRSGRSLAARGLSAPATSPYYVIISNVQPQQFVSPHAEEKLLRFLSCSLSEALQDEKSTHSNLLLLSPVSAACAFLKTGTKSPGRTDPSSRNALLLGGQTKMGVVCV